MVKGMVSLMGQRRLNIISRSSAHGAISPSEKSELVVAFRSQQTEPMVASHPRYPQCQLIAAALWSTTVCVAYAR